MMGWDLSDVDAQDRPLHHPFPRSMWMFVLGIVVVLAVHALAGWLRPRAWDWIGTAGTVAIESWYLWRGLAGRVHGANLAGAGAVMLLPVVLLVTFVPAWIASRVATRAQPIRSA